MTVKYLQISCFVYVQATNSVVVANATANSCLLTQPAHKVVFLPSWQIKGTVQKSYCSGEVGGVESYISLCKKACPSPALLIFSLNPLLDRNCKGLSPPTPDKKNIWHKSALHSKLVGTEPQYWFTTGTNIMLVLCLLFCFLGYLLDIILFKH